MAAPTSSFTQTLRVTPEHLDALDHVNNLIYAGWVLDVATAHWEANTTPEIRAEVSWVMIRHELDYLRSAGLDDEIRITTRVGHLERLTFERLTEVFDATHGHLLVKSRTLWVPVDSRTGRPRRVSQELRDLFSVPPG